MSKRLRLGKRERAAKRLHFAQRDARALKEKVARCGLPPCHDANHTIYDDIFAYRMREVPPKRIYRVD